MTSPETIRVYNASDTYANQYYPSTPLNGLTYFSARAAGSSRESYGYIYFPRPFPLGATIHSATLRLYQKGSTALSHTVSLQRITQSWAVSKLTWNVKPTSTSTGQVQVTKGASGNNTEWAWNVQALLQLVANGTAWYGFRLSTSANEHVIWNASEAAIVQSLKPVLEVVWSEEPHAPTTMSPSGNRAVSLAKPVLRFDFTDKAGNTSLQAVQVQIDAAQNWGAPGFDSGTVLTSDAQLDLNATAYAGLAADASTYWRVRVQDGAGLWSAWSAAAQFQRKLKGTTALTNPPVSGLITEPTPPIIWTFSGNGRTQTAWLVYVTPAADPTTTLYNSGKVTGTQTSHTLPAGVLKDDSSYTVNVWIWDEISREATPGDGTVMPASRSFTYDYDALTTPVTSLVLVDQSPKPIARLTWSRATAPDSFAVRRDGIIIASNLDPALYSTGGTNYAYIDEYADPQVQHTWSVHAVVNGKTSASNPTVVGTLRHVGVWLMDPTVDRYVDLLESEVSAEMGEQAESFMPVGATRVVRITQALRGLEGTVTGRIMDSATGTMAAKESNLYIMKGTPSRTYYLALGNKTIPVVIGNVSVTPLRVVAAQGKQVSFSFWQVGALPFTVAL